MAGRSRQGRSLTGILAIVGVVFLGLGAFAAPVANDDTAAANAGQTIYIDVLSNDTDVAGGTLSIESHPSNGQAAVSNGRIRYTPDPLFAGIDTFVYKVQVGVESDTASVTVEVTNHSPDAQSAVVTGAPDEPIFIRLEVQDEDLDPTDPDQHVLTFEIIQSPKYGTVVGDLGAVYYESPATAFVDVTYTPNAGFAGSDLLVYAVRDPLGSVDIGTVRIEITEVPLPEGYFYGQWNTVIAFLPVFPEMTSLLSAVEVDYERGAFSIGAEAKLDEDGFAGLLLELDTSFVDVLDLSGDLRFHAGDTPFQNLRLITSFAIDALSVRHTFYLPEPMDGTYQRFNVQARFCSFSLTNRLLLEGCSFAFAENDLLIRWSECDFNLSARLLISCEDGFELFGLTVDRISLLPEFLPMRAKLETTFTVDAKQVELAFSCPTLLMDCLRFRCEILQDEADPYSWQGFSLYGVELRSNIGEAVSVWSATSFDETKNASVTGFSDYFEVLSLSGTLPSCCGGPGVWRTSTYFAADSVDIFDWGMTTVAVDVALSDRYRVSTEMTYLPDTADWLWKLGWRLFW